MGKSERAGNLTNGITNVEGQKAANRERGAKRRRAFISREIIEANNLRVLPGRHEFVDIEEGTILQSNAKRPSKGLTGEIGALRFLAEEPTTFRSTHLHGGVGDSLE